MLIQQKEKPPRSEGSNAAKIRQAWDYPSTLCEQPGTTGTPRNRAKPRETHFAQARVEGKRIDSLRPPTTPEEGWGGDVFMILQATVI